MNNSKLKNSLESFKVKKKTRKQNNKRKKRSPKEIFMWEKEMKVMHSMKINSLLTFRHFLLS